MAEERDEFINPDSWTPQELLKHLYREVNILKEENSELQEKVREMELAQEKAGARMEEREKEVDRKISRGNNWIAVIAIGVSIASFLLSYFLK